MFDIGWTELLLIGIVALIVVGPKDLPGMFRTLGRFMGKARAMAREFQRAMEQAADDSGVKDMAREFRDSASGKDFGADELRSLAKGPKAWAKQAARSSVVKPTPEEEAEDTAPGEAKPARPRGPATEALAAKRAREAEARRAQLKPAGDAADDASAPAGQAEPAAGQDTAAAPAPSTASRAGDA